MSGRRRTPRLTLPAHRLGSCVSARPVLAAIEPLPEALTADLGSSFGDTPARSSCARISAGRKMSFHECRSCWAPASEDWAALQGGPGQAGRPCSAFGRRNLHRRRRALRGVAIGPARRDPGGLVLHSPRTGTRRRDAQDRITVTSSRKPDAPGWRPNRGGDPIRLSDREATSLTVACRSSLAPACRALWLLPAYVAFRLSSARPNAAAHGPALAARSCRRGRSSVPPQLGATHAYSRPGWPLRPHPPTDRSTPANSLP